MSNKQLKLIEWRNRKLRKIWKYLVYWKEFIVENNIWKKEKDLENTKEAVAKFEGKMNVEI